MLILLPDVSLISLICVSCAQCEALVKVWCNAVSWSHL